MRILSFYFYLTNFMFVPFCLTLQILYKLHEQTKLHECHPWYRPCVFVHSKFGLIKVGPFYFIPVHFNWLFRSWSLVNAPVGRTNYPNKPKIRIHIEMWIKLAFRCLIFLKKNTCKSKQLYRKYQKSSLKGGQSYDKKF